MLNIIIPTLNCASVLERTMAALGDDYKVIVVDGGSVDSTPQLAHDLGAEVVVTPRGRGAQLAAGANVVKGGWLLFLHADTVLGEGWREAVASFMENPQNMCRAAVFRLKFDDPSPAARRLERMAAWRGFPYGDQGLLISHDFYHELGGFADIPLMEDVDMIRRIGRGRIVTFDVKAVTSAARYGKEGYVLRPLRNFLCLGLYFLGVPPRWIVKVYG